MKNHTLNFVKTNFEYSLENIQNNQMYSIKSLFTIHLKDSPKEWIEEKDLNIQKENKTENTWEIFYEPIYLEENKLELSLFLQLDKNQLLGQLHLSGDVKDEKIIVDYIDFLPLAFSKENLVFTHPTDQSIVQTGYNYLEKDLLLGQPVYAKGFYFGSRFPANDNQAVEKDGEWTLQLRYYSGQALQCLVEENFVSWTFVAGATRGVTYEEMKEEFLKDIDKISLKTPLRIQYNSWYDAFMDVTEEQFLHLAKEMNRFVEENHLPQFDAYVLDDGWNNYNDPKYTGIDVKRSGHTYNKSGFWEFNDKFPNEATKINEYLKSIGSTFGLWFGPQGGYELQDTFAKYLEEKGNAHVNKQAAIGEAIDVNDSKYIEKVQEMMIDYQKRFEITYWKLDGFATCACTNPNHRHLVGGYNNHYYTTQLWERWLHLFEEIRKVTPDIFLNLTSYTPISPWFLQWVNTIWLQNSGDLEIARDADGSVPQQMITGRDLIFKKKVFEEKAQVELSRFYNHEPIYGHRANVEITTEEFKAYLYTNIFRSSLLWDLHLSPDMLTKAQWEILKEVLLFLKNNIEVLKHNDMILLNDELYGYIAKNHNQGFLFVRNPKNKEIALDVSTLPAYWQKKWQEEKLTAIMETKGGVGFQPFEYKIFQIKNEA